MIETLEQIGPLASELLARAARSQNQMIWRSQTRHVRSVAVQDGKTESTGSVRVSGHGIQVLAPSGATTLGSRDDSDPKALASLVDRLIAIGQRSDRLGLATARWPTDLPVVQDRAFPDPAIPTDGGSLAAIAKTLIDLERQLGDGFPDLITRLSYRYDYDAWRILRDDGSDVLFGMPRGVLVARFTGQGEEGQQGLSASASSPRADLHLDADSRAVFLSRASRTAQLTMELLDAPQLPAGSYPLIIDYALAKGLAHEAFGHASEADGFRSSVLAEEGRFRVGESVGPEHVSIIDEPVANDHAWQPFSSNGLPRKPVRIVESGRLKEGLSDPWSAEAGGVPLTASGRAESFRNAPLPRMTNIRIECTEPLAAPGEFEDYGAEEVRALVANAGVLARYGSMVYLSGYRGGQVNTASGDFVFNCKAIYRFSERGIELFRPAIFSGSMFGALRAIREAFGPLKLDAIGYCGKWGQSVPSSGGSHYFLVLDPDPSVRLGGS